LLPQRHSGADNYYRRGVAGATPYRAGEKTFVIEAHNTSPANRYIQSATFNGKPLNQWWIRQRDLINGGRLVLNLGPKPNKNWAKGCPLPE
jgi:putative alpha-1,2-mannosidase